MDKMDISCKWEALSRFSLWVYRQKYKRKIRKAYKGTISVVVGCYLACESRKSWVDLEGKGIVVILVILRIVIDNIWGLFGWFWIAVMIFVIL
jgi:hypothetical protein